VDPLSARKKEVYDEYIMSGGGFNLPIYTKMAGSRRLKTDPKLAISRGRA